jgi:hypothetical protein
VQAAAGTVEATHIASLVPRIRLLNREPICALRQ